MRRIVKLSGTDDVAGWRRNATELLEAAVAPEEVDWRLAHEDIGDLFSQSAIYAPPLAPPSSEHASEYREPVAAIPSGLLLHRDPERFVLAY